MEWNTYPLSLMGVPGRELQLSLSYDEARFDAATIARLMSHLERLLEQMSEDADRPLADLALIGEAERRMVVEEWNRTEAAFPRRAVHPPAL